MRRTTVWVLALAIVVLLGATAQDFVRPGYPHYTLPWPVDSTQLLRVFLRDDAAIDMTVNGSVTPVEYTYTVPAGKVLYLDAMTVIMEDAGMEPDEFGGLGNALSTGMLFKIEDDEGAESLDLLDGTTIRDNTEFGLLGSESLTRNSGANSDSLVVSWERESGEGTLRLGAGYSVVVTVQDDLTAIAKFEIMLKGMLFDEGVVY